MALLARSATSVATSRAARPSARTAVVVRASADRRAVLSGLVAGVALSTAAAAQALSEVDLFNDTKAKATGFDLIYEARDESLPLSTRAGFDQARGDLESTKARVKESEARLDTALESPIKKAYWTDAREELRRQVGTLRFDLNTLAAATGSKDAKTKALALRKAFIAKVEDLDYALRKKDSAAAIKGLESAKGALDAVLAAVL